MLIYLAEAHAEDTWPLSRCAPPRRAQVHERVEAVQQLLAQNPQLAALVQDRVYVDGQQNAITLEYGLWPERYLLLEGNKVLWASALTYEARANDMSKDIPAAAAAVSWHN
mmetsp:Transcript_15908/g.29105  ORF Transcript_15908/g.29105 Transcript_15908/m.29105 type:complete len:111 (+) Transcript_15908:836-1168(+)